MWTLVLPLLFLLHQGAVLWVLSVVARGRRQIEQRKHWTHDRPDWRPFERRDAPFGSVECARIWLCASLLLPFRLALVLSGFFTMWGFVAAARRLGYSDRSQQGVPEFVRRLHLLLGSLLARTLLLGLGVWSVRRVGHPPSDLTDSRIFCNHSSFVDILVLMSEVMPAFVSKQAIQKAPGVGAIAEFASSIFVRQEGGSGQSEAIRLRQEAMATERQRYPPLLVFPEGTTTNNRCMMPFKTGALRASGRFHLMFIRWTNPHFSPTWEALPFLVAFLGIMTQWSNGLEVHYLSSLTLSENDIKDPASLAQRLSGEMAGAMGVEVVPTSYHAKQEYLEWLRKQHSHHPQTSPKGD